MIGRIEARAHADRTARLGQISGARFLLHLEGAVILAVAVALYARVGAGWGLFAALILAPDLFMLGYVIGPRTGAHVYNAVHTFAVPVVVATLGVLLGAQALTAVGLVWIAHIGMDRAVGFGLKYTSSFSDTHFSRL